MYINTVYVTIFLYVLKEEGEEGVEAAAAPTSEEVINKIVTSVVEAVQAEMEEVSDFVRWASRALNPLVSL